MVMKMQFEIPKPLVKEKNYNFSFSGIKTHINFLTKKNKLNDNLFMIYRLHFKKQ